MNHFTILCFEFHLPLVHSFRQLLYVLFEVLHYPPHSSQCFQVSHYPQILKLCPAHHYLGHQYTLVYVHSIYSLCTYHGDLLQNEALIGKEKQMQIPFCLLHVKVRNVSGLQSSGFIIIANRK